MVRRSRGPRVQATGETVITEYNQEQPSQAARHASKADRGSYQTPEHTCFPYDRGAVVHRGESHRRVDRTPQRHGCGPSHEGNVAHTPRGRSRGGGGPSRSMAPAAAPAIVMRPWRSCPRTTRPPTTRGRTPGRPRRLAHPTSPSRSSSWRSSAPGPPLAFALWSRPSPPLMKIVDAGANHALGRGRTPRPPSERTEKHLTDVTQVKLVGGWEHARSHRIS